MTFSLILNILLTAILGYVAFNTFLHYQFSINRFFMMFSIISVAIMIVYLDTEKTLEFIIAEGIVAIIFCILYLYFLKRHNHGYFFFNIYRKDYPKLHEEINMVAKKYGIEANEICHDRCKPYLAVFKHKDIKAVRKVIKEIDLTHTKTKIRFTMYSYWALVVYLILVTIIWRF